MRSLLIYFVLRPQMLGVPLFLLYGLNHYSFATKPNRRMDWLVLASLIAIPAELASYSLVSWMSRIRPYKYDDFIFRLDGIFGFQPSFAIGAVVSRHYWLNVAITVAYGSFSIAVLAVFAAYLWRRSEREAIALAKTFALNLFAAVPIYLLIPVCGPRFAYPGFPDVAPQVVPHPMLILAPPNAIPSVHFANALLVAWFARHWLWGRYLGIAFVILTAVATLGHGEHYLFDLIAAFPYAYLVSRVFVERKAPVDCVRLREEVGVACSPEPSIQQ